MSLLRHIKIDIYSIQYSSTYVCKKTQGLQKKWGGVNVVSLLNVQYDYGNIDNNQSQERADSIYTKSDYKNVFINDLLNARNEIVITSTVPDSIKIRRFYKEYDSVRGNSVKLICLVNEKLDITKKVGSHDVENCRSNQHNKAIDILKERFDVYYKNKTICACMAVIDRKIVWYGFIDFLGNCSDESDSIRIKNEKTANRILRGLFEQKSYSYQTSLIE